MASQILITTALKKCFNCAAVIAYRENVHGAPVDPNELTKYAGLLNDLRRVDNGVFPKVPFKQVVLGFANSMESKWKLCNEKEKWASQTANKLRAMLRDVQQALVKKEYNAKTAATATPTKSWISQFMDRDDLYGMGSDAGEEDPEEERPKEVDEEEDPEEEDPADEVEAGAKMKRPAKVMKRPSSNKLELQDFTYGWDDEQFVAWRASDAMSTRELSMEVRADTETNKVNAIFKNTDGSTTTWTVPGLQASALPRLRAAGGASQKGSLETHWAKTTGNVETYVKDDMRKQNHSYIVWQKHADKAGKKDQVTQLLTTDVEDKKKALLFMIDLATKVHAGVMSKHDARVAKNEAYPSSSKRKLPAAASGSNDGAKMKRPAAAGANDDAQNDGENSTKMKRPAAAGAAAADEGAGDDSADMKRPAAAGAAATGKDDDPMAIMKRPAVAGAAASEGAGDDSAEVELEDDDDDDPDLKKRPAAALRRPAAAPDAAQKSSPATAHEADVGGGQPAAAEEPAAAKTTLPPPPPMPIFLSER